MAINFTLASFLQFMQDLPFSTIGSAAASGGLNVALDVAAGEAIAAAAVKDFFTSGGTATAPTTAAAAPATAAAVANHVANA